MEPEKEKKYLDLITRLKILAIREYTKENEEKVEEYKEMVKTLNKIKENSKLDLLGQKTERTFRYERLLEDISKNYDGQSDNIDKIHPILIEEVKKDKTRIRRAEDVER